MTLSTYLNYVAHYNLQGIYLTCHAAKNNTLLFANLKDFSNFLTSFLMLLLCNANCCHVTKSSISGFLSNASAIDKDDFEPCASNHIQCVAKWLYYSCKK